jgi:FlaA1/EpsC-like NDP-sugar epimerase
LGEVRAWVDRLGVEDVIIAVGALSGESLNRILDALDLRATRVRIIPSPGESLLERMSVDRTREIRAEDLLGRKGVDLDDALMKEFFRGKTVFITGAGGSIGSEICHQLLSYPLAGLVCLSRSEYSLYRLQEKLAGENSDAIPISWYLGDVRDGDRMLEIALRHRPNFIFHAAAHKHVPYMETHEKEAFKNNVLGTESVLDAARACGAERFILVSTDKAVRPTNVMGASKRLAELLVTWYGAKHGIHTALVRFGNVLGSRGSVVPLFRRQILKGGPITVTHPDVVRFFMTVTEAALLVMSCAALSKGGERFILDMGEPVRIDDLVRRMIRLYRYEPDRDIPIAYTGLRPGEKLYEELLTGTEAKGKTGHPKIFVLHDEQAPPEGYGEWLSRMKADMPNLTGEDIRREMLRLIPDFKPLGPDGKDYVAKS